ncbi:DUF4936 family protein [Noviherbaspirillum galbum]|uniref:DUF4936 family protein n=1 Tax=Noviherbaspirillum galbum TaxID=2709383 RepID=A0A6B3SGC7_9BURK|nr:DUF4936 family protein [Noviherbaspirillum galbum]NEX59708.1 DUF4936 family protein [Noviherbaspirillum galbum]
MDLYVYYRVDPRHADALRDRVLAMQSGLTREYGIVTGLKRRPEEKDGRQTWMETYAGVTAGARQGIDRAVEQAGLASFIDGQRHVECFVDVAPCA